MNSRAIGTETLFHIHASPSQSALLRKAAQTRHVNVSQFVLQSGLEAAEKAVRGETSLAIIPVGTAEFSWLMEKLDEPPQEVPALRRLLSETPVWNG